MTPSDVLGFLTGSSDAEAAKPPLQSFLTAEQLAQRAARMKQEALAARLQRDYGVDDASKLSPDQLKEHQRHEARLEWQRQHRANKPDSYREAEATRRRTNYQEQSPEDRRAELQRQHQNTQRRYANLTPDEKSKLPAAGGIALLATDESEGANMPTEAQEEALKKREREARSTPVPEFSLSQETGKEPKPTTGFRKLGDKMMSLAKGLREEAGGRVEPAMAIGSGVLAMAPAAVSAGIEAVKGGDAGKRFGEFMAGTTYKPKTEKGQEHTETISRFMASLPPYLGGPSVLRQVAPAGVGAYAREAGNEVAKLGNQLASEMGQGVGARVVRQPNQGFFTTNAGNIVRREMLGAIGDAPAGVAPEYMQWVDQKVPRWLKRYASVPDHPGYGTQIGGSTFGQHMDTSVGKVRPDRVGGLLEQELAAQGYRPGDDVFRLTPTETFLSVLNHAGDIARQDNPRRLANTGMEHYINRALQDLTRNERVRGARERTLLERQLAASARLTQGEEPFVEGPHGSNWYRFNARSHTPEQIERQMSVDTCVGRHCIGGAALLGRDLPQDVRDAARRYGFTEDRRWVPIYDPVTGDRVFGGVRGLENRSTDYAQNVARGKSEYYSLRNPTTGEVHITSDSPIHVPSGVPRAMIRGGKGAGTPDNKGLIDRGLYDAWQKQRAQEGVNPENIRMLLPGGGQGSPDRGLLSRAQVEDILRYAGPERGARIDVEKMFAPQTRLHSQFHGTMNRDPSFRFAEEGAQLLNKLREEGAGMGSTAQKAYSKLGTFTESDVPAIHMNHPIPRVRTWMDIMREVPAERDTTRQALERMAGIPGQAVEYALAGNPSRLPAQYSTDAQASTVSNIMEMLARRDREFRGR